MQTPSFAIKLARENEQFRAQIERLKTTLAETERERDAARDMSGRWKALAKRYAGWLKVYIPKRPPRMVLFLASANTNPERCEVAHGQLNPS